MQLSVQLQRALQPKIRLQKGLILNELVQCRRRIDVFEAFTMAESVLQLGLQKMDNVHVPAGTATTAGFFLDDVASRPGRQRSRPPPRAHAARSNHKI